MRSFITGRIGLLALAVVCGACAATPETETATPAETKAPATTTSVAAELTESTTTEPPAPELPAWLEPLEIQDAAMATPEALAFADNFVDPGGHYSVSIGPEWELTTQIGLDQAPLTQWKLGDVELIATSAPLPETPLADFVEGLRGEVVYLDDTRAVTRSKPDDERSAIQLHVHEVQRIATLTVVFNDSDTDVALNAAVTPMATLARTPFTESDLGEPGALEVEYWLGQFDSMSEQDRAEYGDPEATATCIAGGLASPVLARYPEEATDPSAIDVEDQHAMMTYGNFQADLEEILAYCGMPPGSFGTWEPGATYQSEFRNENFEAFLADVFPVASENFAEVDIDPRSLAQDICAIVGTADDPDSIESQLRGLEPDGVFGPDEDFDEFLALSAMSICPNELEDLRQRAES